MTTYWVKFDYNMLRESARTQDSLLRDHESVMFRGHSMNTYAVYFYGSIVQTFQGGQTSYYRYPWFLSELEYAAVIKGYWDGGHNMGSGFHDTGVVQWTFTIDIVDQFVVGSQPDPTVFVGPTLADTEYDDLREHDVTVGWSDWAWTTVSVPPVPLFTANADEVDFNALLPEQQDTIRGGADVTDGLGGGDTVTLPDRENYDVSVGLGQTLDWEASAPFKTNSRAGDRYKITGGDGSDTIVGGDGKEIFYGSPGNDSLTGGGGADEFNYVKGRFPAFRNFGDGTKQTLLGGSDGSETERDLLVLPGSADRYRITTKVSLSWETTQTIIETVSEGRTQVVDANVQSFPSIILDTTQIELLKYAEGFSGAEVELYRGNLIAEAIHLAIDAYESSTNAPRDRNWHPISAIELGIKPADFSTEPTRYKLVDGHYSAAGADALVLFGIVNGLKTLALVFRGTDESSDIPDYFPFAKHYEKYSPLLETLPAALSLIGAQQILVSGHSLGASMVQYFLSKFPTDLAINAFTIASPGAEVQPPGHDLVNFIHVSDPVNLSLLFPNTDRAGSTVYIRYRSFFSAHQSSGYEEDLQTIIDYSRNEQSLFYDHPLARSLSAGEVYSGPNVVINLGYSILSDDTLILGESTDDVFSIIIADVVAAGPRYLDGGIGFDTLIIHGVKPSAFTFRENAKGHTLFTKSGASDDQLVVHYTGVEKIVIGGAIFGADGTAYSRVSDGYVSGATVFRDRNANRLLDFGEESAITGSMGEFVPLTGEGRLIAFGGADITTGLPLKGTMSASQDALVISPLSTVLIELEGMGHTSIQAETALLTAMGLDSSLSLANLDGLAAMLDGDDSGGAAFVAGAAVYNMVSLIVAGLAGVNADPSAEYDKAFLALATLISSRVGQILDFTHKATIVELIEDFTTIGDVGMTPISDAVATLIVASNAALADMVEGHHDASGTLVLGINAVQYVVQSSVFDGLRNAHDNADDVVAAYTGANLKAAINSAMEYLTPKSSIEAGTGSIYEGDVGGASYSFTVSLDRVSLSQQTVDWKLTGSGQMPADAADFGGALPTGTVTFASGEISKLVTIEVSGDSAAESNEGFLVSLSNLSLGLELGTATASGTILDDDGSVSIAALAAAKAEGNTGTTAFTFTVTTTGEASTTRSVSWAVAGSTASKADGGDFVGGTLPTGILTFAPNETSKVLTITVVGEATMEPDEGFVVTLSNPSSSLKIGMGSASGTIQNDDVPVIVVTHDDAYVVLKGQSLTIAALAGVLHNDESAATASLLTNTSHGPVQLGSTGGFTYTPTAGFTGIDSFTYHAVPGGNGVDGKATVYVVPVNVGTSITLDLLGLTAAEQIAATYTAFFGRAADAGGHGFWVGQFVQNLPTQGPAALFANIASSFGVSDEAKALYPFLANPFGASDVQISAFLDSVYNNLFNRSSDAGGLAYWTGQIKQTLQAGQFVGSVLVNIMSGAQDTAAGKDITTLMGKVAVSLEYVREQQDHHTSWLVSDVAASTALLQTVTADPLSVLVGIRNAENLITAHA